MYVHQENEALDSSFKNHLLIKFDGQRFTVLFIFQINRNFFYRLLFEKILPYIYKKWSLIAF